MSKSPLLQYCRYRAESLLFRQTNHCGDLFQCLDHCDWASCFEWCLSKPNFCTQLWATVRYLIIFFFSSNLGLYPLSSPLYFLPSLHLPSVLSFSSLFLLFFIPLYFLFLPSFSYPKISNILLRLSSFSTLSSLFLPSI